MRVYPGLESSAGWTRGFEGYVELVEGAHNLFCEELELPGSRLQFPIEGAGREKEF